MVCTISVMMRVRACVRVCVYKVLTCVQLKYSAAYCKVGDTVIHFTQSMEVICGSADCCTYMDEMAHKLLTLPIMAKH